MQLESLEARRLLASDDYSVIDTNSYGSGSLFNKSVVHGTDLYYVDTDPVHGAELRRLDTTTGQVFLFADINPGIGDSVSGGLMNLLGDKLFFSAYDPQFGDEVRWIDLAQATPTIHTVDIWSGPYSSKPGNLGGSIVVGNKLYFTIEDQQRSEDMLCWIDTTLDNPTPNFVDHMPGGSNEYKLPSGETFTSAGNKIYFVGGALDELGYEVQWIDTEATPSTVNTLDLTPGPNSTFPWITHEFGGITTVADKVFIRKNGDHPFTVWLDASLPTPVVHNNSLLGSVIANGDLIYSFMPNENAIGGIVAWADATKSDLDFNTVEVSSTIYLNQVTVEFIADSKMYVSVGTYDNSDFYWIDLASASPSLQKLLFTETNGRAFDNNSFGPRAGAISGTNTRHFAFINHKLYFPAIDDYGNELRWVDTLSSSPSVHTLDISIHNELRGKVRGSYPGQYGGLVPVGDKLFFVADDSDNVVGIEPDALKSYDALGKSMLRWIDTTSDDPVVNTIALGTSGYGGPWGFTIVGSRMIYKSASYSADSATTQWIDLNEENPTIHTIADGAKNRSFTAWPDQPNHMFGVNGNHVFFDTDGLLYRTDLSDASPQAERVLGPGTRYAGIYGGYASIGSKIYFYGSDSELEKQKLRWLDVSEEVPTIHTIDVRGYITPNYGSQGSFFFVSGTRLFFQGISTDNREGVQWIDTSEDQPQVHTLGISSDSLDDRVVQVADKIYFLGIVPFWVSASAAIPQVNRITNVTGPLCLAFTPKVVGDKIYFDASGKLNWIDTTKSPSVLKVLQGGYKIDGKRTDTGLRQLAVADSKLFFDVERSGLKWIDLDSPQPPIYSLDNLDNGQFSQYTRVVTSIGNRVYYIASDSLYGSELRWINAWDPNFTVHTVDVSSGPSDSVLELGLQSLAVSDNKLYFSALTTGQSKELVALAIPPNHAPTNLTISQSNFIEGHYPKSEVASFHTEDIDTDYFRYSLVSGDGDDDNALFQIINDKLVQHYAFDFENQPSFTIRVRTTDSSNASFERSFVLSVSDVPEPPSVYNDTYNVPINYMLFIGDANNGTLANDFDSDGDAITATLVSGPFNGTLSFNSDGTFVYTPASNSDIGQRETFTYLVTDETGLSTTGRVTLTISSPIMSPYYNQTTHTDVSPGTSPGSTSSIDALAIINLLNAHRGRVSIAVRELPQLLPPAFFYDVNNDFVVSPLDILAIYNFLNARSRGGEGETVGATSTSISQASLFDAAIVDLTDLPNKKRP